MGVAPSSLFRTGLPLIALVLTAGASAENIGAPEAVPPEPVPGAQTAEADPNVVCRDRIHMARQERGLPMLQRDTATPDEALMIKAVDYRLGGCGVMVMHHDANDIRPVPASEGPARLQRIR